MVGGHNHKEEEEADEGRGLMNGCQECHDYN